MADPPTDEQIVEALGRTGYLFEQEVATLFEDMGYNVATNTAFEDPEESKSRELDVRATLRKVVNREHTGDWLFQGALGRDTSTVRGSRRDRSNSLRPRRIR